jgi:hypothetical protein
MGRNWSKHSTSPFRPISSQRLLLVGVTRILTFKASKSGRSPKGTRLSLVLTVLEKQAVLDLRAVCIRNRPSNKTGLLLVLSAGRCSLSSEQMEQIDRICFKKYIANETHPAFNCAFEHAASLALTTGGLDEVLSNLVSVHPHAQADESANM